MSLTCVLCGHTDDVEIVSHINKEHPEGGLKKYLLFFPFLHVVNNNDSHHLFTAIENAVYFKYIDNSIPGMDKISEEDRQLIIKNAERQRIPRSEIVVEDDF